MYRTSGAWTTRHLLAITVIAAAVVTSACSKGSGDSNDQRAGAGASASAPDSNRSGAGVARVAKVPELPAKIEDISAADFVKVVDTISWTGHIVERQCEGALSGCSNAPGNTSTVVRHEAAAGANDLDIGALPDNGVVVSRMQNLGKRKEKLFGLKSGGEYYMILTRGATAGSANYQLVNLDFDGRGRPKLDLLPGKHPIGPCDSEHHDAASAGFKECPLQPAPASPLVLPTSFNRGAWFTCSLGCCTTDGVRGGTGRGEGRDSTTTDSTAPDSTRRQQQPR